jgi:Tol biopolymer transport system component
VQVPVTNVLYAEWSPVTPRLLAYTTADRISRAPGWQANNNLWLTTFNARPGSRSLVFTSTRVLDSSSGGAYGWWGTGFAFAPDGATIAYARTDSIGLLDVVLSTKKFTATVSASELLQFTPYNTHSDWAWYPPMRWAPDGKALYTITHGAPIGLEAAEDSPAFDLTALLVPAALQFKLIPRSGMFANPVPSPLQPGPNGVDSFRVAFLQATDPNNSPFTTYRLGVMDRDGSNARFIFPPEGQPGLSANQVVSWSPDGRLLAVVYDGNLWLVNPDTGVSQQLTGDGLATTPRWAP